MKHSILIRYKAEFQENDAMERDQESFSVLA